MTKTSPQHAGSGLVFHNEGRSYLRCCFRGGIKAQFNHAACQTSREEAAATDVAGQKASAQAGSQCGRRPETHLLLHLWPSQIRPLRARASLGEAASINSLANYQVKPHRRPLHLRVLSQTLVPLLRPHLHPPLCLRALTVLKDDRGLGLGLASRQFEAALSGASVMKGGNRLERAAKKE